MMHFFEGKKCHLVHKTINFQNLKIKQGLAATLGSNLAVDPWVEWLLCSNFISLKIDYRYYLWLSTDKNLWSILYTNIVLYICGGVFFFHTEDAIKPECDNKYQNMWLFIYIPLVYWFPMRLEFNWTTKKNKHLLLLSILNVT